MTRSTAREIAVHLVFATGYNGMDAEQAMEKLLDESYYPGLSGENEIYQERPNKKQLAYIRSVVDGCAAHAEELDAIISHHAIGWKLNRISRLVRSILQVAIYEVLYVEDVPTGVAINEAVKLTRKYEDEEVVSFVNGILGAFSRELAQNLAPAAPEQEDAQ